MLLNFHVFKMWPEQTDEQSGLMDDCREFHDAGRRHGELLEEPAPPGPDFGGCSKLLVLNSFRIVLLKAGDLYPPHPPRGHLTMSGDIFGGDSGCFRHLVSRGQGHCSASHSAQDSLITRNRLALYAPRWRSPAFCSQDQQS